MPDIDFGNYYALVIGINEYRALPKLQTAKNDVNAVSRILKESYGYTVKTMLDATRRDILMALGEYRKTLTEKDNLLIYYAGYGWLDEEANEGYWIPVNGQIDNMNP